MMFLRKALGGDVSFFYSSTRESRRISASMLEPILEVKLRFFLELGARVVCIEPQPNCVDVSERNVSE